MARYLSAMAELVERSKEHTNGIITFDERGERNVICNNIVISVAGISVRKTTVCA